MFQTRCIGEESDIKRKLCSEQTQRCKEEGCPVMSNLMRMIMMMMLMRRRKMMMMKRMKI